MPVHDEKHIISGFSHYPPCVKFHYRKKQLFSHHSDSALWTDPERGCTIKSTCHYLFFHSFVLFARPLCCVPHTAMNDIKIQSHTQLPLLPLTWSCLSLCVSDCHCSDSCQHTVPGWWLRGPFSEPSPRGWAQRRLWRSACRIRERERATWNREIGAMSQVFSNTVKVQEDTAESGGWECFKWCKSRDKENSTRLKVNNIEPESGKMDELFFTPWSWSGQNSNIGSLKWP